MRRPEKIPRYLSQKSRVFLLCAIAGAAQILPGNQALAQEHIHPDRGPFEPVVDGSARLQDVPDSVAIRVLMQSLRASLNEDPGLRQLYSRVQRAELSNADVQILIRGLGEFDSRARNQEARLQAVRPASEVASQAEVARFRAEGVAYDNLIADQYRQMIQSMSLEGAAKMREHLDHVKSRIKIYPSPDMSARNNSNQAGEHHE